MWPFKKKDKTITSVETKEAFAFIAYADRPQRYSVEVVTSNGLFLVQWGEFWIVLEPNGVIRDGDKHSPAIRWEKEDDIPGLTDVKTAA